MLLSSVIIILHEVIEAALLLSILIAVTKQIGLDLRWLFWTLLIGSCSAAAYAMSVENISDWFDGVGQEVSNAAMQLLIYLLLVWYLLLLSLFLDRHKVSNKALKIIMIIVTSLAITREGAEVILYFLSVTRSETYYLSAIVGMSIGASIGISMGLLIYYLLTNLSSQKAIFIGLILLLLIALGMVSQASLLLIQADWLPAQLPLWDTSAVIAEQSLIGQLLHALIGYESSPSAIQLILYLCAFILPFVLIIGVKIRNIRSKGV